MKKILSLALTLAWVVLIGSMCPEDQDKDKATIWPYICLDRDGDGYGVGGKCLGKDCDDADPNNWISCSTCLDVDGDGFGSSGCDINDDCNDANAWVNPVALEFCDGIDNQCPGDPGYGEIDEGCSYWAWISGSTVIDQNGVYGTKGTPAPGNVPGARSEAVSWIDGSGDLWLFGGAGILNDLNDLWRWDGSNWTWISGSPTDQNGVYVTKGTPDPANVPGARIGAVSWIDGSGNFWLFGGVGFDAIGGLGYLNDLWRWDGNNWTWISGSKALELNGVYGTKGTPNPANVPGGRELAVSWIDGSGDLWLFGGQGYGYAATGNWGWLNDLWRWDGSNWTWISGSKATDQFGVYGTLGRPKPANVPGARWGPASWIDGSGNLWLFGGWGFASGKAGWLNDLWRWDGSNWTWINGSSTTDQLGVYGTRGTPDPTNLPGARQGAVSWIDGSGNLWLFGGIGMFADGGGWGPHNDFWRWDGNNWTWISASNAENQNGIYGTKGTPDPGNVPGARSGAVSWIDGSGDLWLFGGYGCDANGTDHYLNDLWRFSRE